MAGRDLAAGGASAESPTFTLEDVLSSVNFSKRTDSEQQVGSSSKDMFPGGGGSSFSHSSSIIFGGGEMALLLTFYGVITVLGLAFNAAMIWVILGGWFRKIVRASVMIFPVLISKTALIVCIKCSFPASLIFF